MPRLVLLVLLCLCLSQSALSQKYAVKGSVTDEKSAALPSATVLLLHPRDSTTIYNTITSRQGTFEIKNVIRSEYLLKVTYLGFTSYFRKIALSASQPTLDVGSLKLQPVEMRLGEVQIQGERSPVVYKTDTVEFNASSFKTQPNATVEDLVKKLPGLEVGTNGQVKAQGEAVSKVLVDGKPFFGKDPAIAMKNLPADAIDKVQVVNEKSEQAKFSGVDDGQREKVINLTLKKDKKQMGFGKASGGLGSDNRYQGNLNYNRFNKGNQLSVLGMSNNVNQQGFSYGDYQQFNTGGQPRQNEEGSVFYNNTGQRGVPINFGNRNNGNTYSNAGGVNFFQQVNKKLELNGSYFLNHLSQQTRRFGTTESFLPIQGNTNSGRFFSTDSSFTTHTNLAHTVNLSLDYKLDSLNSLKISSAFSLSRNSNTSHGNNQRLSETGERINENAYRSANEGESATGSLNLLFRHRFRTRGRSFTAAANLGNNQNDHEGRSISRSQVRSGAVQALNRENQYGFGNTNKNLTLTYTEPIAEKTFLEGHYSLSHGLNSNQGDIFDLVDEQRRHNDTLSTQSEQNNLTHKAGVTFRRNRAKYNFSVGAGLQELTQEGDFRARGVMALRRTYRNLLPVASFHYDFSKFQHLRFNYNTYINTPQFTMVQPLVRQYDQLNIYLGNEQLRPSLNNAFHLNYNAYNPVSGLNGYVSLSYNYTLNPITQAVTLNEDFVRTQQFVNVRDNNYLNLYSNIGFPIKKLKSRINLGPNLSRRINYSLLNGQTGRIIQHDLGGNLSYNLDLQESFSFRLHGSLNQQRAEYEHNKERNLATFNSRIGSEATWHVKKNFHLHSNFELSRYRSSGSNFNQVLPIWNASISRQFLKNKAGELKLAALNLLDRDLGIEQYAYNGNVTRAMVNSLGGYYMLSFTYSLNRKLNGPGAARKQ